MENIKIESYGGSHIASAIKEAKQISIVKNRNVEFDFNGKTVVVNKLSNPKLLERDFGNSWLMKWETVGPVCQGVYSKEVREQLALAKVEQENRQAQECAEWNRKDAEEKSAFEEMVKGIEFELTDKAGWYLGISKNQDGYGDTVYKYAEGWAKLMQKEMADGKSLEDIASETSFKLGFLGISGFQYGAAVSILSQTWKHGAELKAWHNKKYNHSGNGVVNPALLTIDKK